jgi:hypothetical protein
MRFSITSFAVVAAAVAAVAATPIAEEGATVSV